MDTYPHTAAETPLPSILAAIDNALRNGSYMTGANLAFNMLCDRLGVDRDRLEFRSDWAAAAGTTAARSSGPTSMPTNQYGAATLTHVADVLARRAPLPTDVQSIARLRANATPNEQSQLRYLLATVMPEGDAARLFSDAGRSMPLYQP